MKATKFLSICSMALVLMVVAPALAQERAPLTQEDQEEELLTQEQELLEQQKRENRAVKGEDDPVEEEFVEPQIFNGTPLPPGIFADTGISVWSTDGGTCAGTLFTNNWVLSAWHCRHFTPGAETRVFYDRTCNPLQGNADCAARGGQCLGGPDGNNYCGSVVATVFDSDGISTGIS